MDHYTEEEQTEKRMSATPIQFVYPGFFRCFHRMGCCKKRGFDRGHVQSQENIMSSLQNVFKKERFLDQYLRDHAQKLRQEEELNDSKLLKIDLLVSLENESGRETSELVSVSNDQFEPEPDAFEPISNSEAQSVLHKSAMQVTQDSYDPLKNLGIGYYAYFNTQNFVTMVLLAMCFLGIVIMVGYNDNQRENFTWYRSSIQTFNIGQGTTARYYCFQ